MTRSRFSEEQIIGILKEQEAGAATADVRAPQHLRPLGGVQCGEIIGSQDPFVSPLFPGKSRLHI